MGGSAQSCPLPALLSQNVGELGSKAVASPVGARWQGHSSGSEGVQAMAALVLASGGSGYQRRQPGSHRRRDPRGGGRALAQLLGGSEGVQQHAVGALASLAANNDANQAAITVKAARVIPLLPAAAGQLPRGCPPGRR